MPVSDTVKRQRRLASVGRRPPHVDDHFAALGELDGVADQVDQHLAQAPGIADERVGHVRSNVAGQLEPFLVRARRQQAHGVLDDVAQVERDVFERQAAAPRSSRNRGCR